MIRLAVLALLLMTSVARAEDLELAKAHFQAGIVSFDRGDYRQALDEFKAADRASHRPELDFNIARAYERLGDAAHAFRYYEKYLAARPRDPDSDETREALKRLERRIGTLEIESPAGTRVTLDGEPIDNRSPAAVTEGPHLLVATRADGRSRQMTAVVTAGTRTRVRVDAEPEPARLAPTSAPALPGLQVTSAPPRPHKKRWPLWLGLGLGAVAVAAVAVAVGVTQSQTVDNFAQARSQCPSCPYAVFR